MHKEERGEKVSTRKKGKNREIKERVKCPNKKGKKGKKAADRRKKKEKINNFYRVLKHKEESTESENHREDPSIKEKRRNPMERKSIPTNKKIASAPILSPNQPTVRIAQRKKKKIQKTRKGETTSEKGYKVIDQREEEEASRLKRRESTRAQSETKNQKTTVLERETE